jgi:hypothetical protein
VHVGFHGVVRKRTFQLQITFKIFDIALPIHGTG